MAAAVEEATISFAIYESHHSENTSSTMTSFFIVPNRGHLGDFDVFSYDIESTNGDVGKNWH